MGSAVETSDSVAVVPAQNTSVVPWLDVAPRLIHKLGWCMAIASTREVARIRLTSKAVRYHENPLLQLCLL